MRAQADFCMIWGSACPRWAENATRAKNIIRLFSFVARAVEITSDIAPASLARSALGPRASRLAKRVGTRHSRRRRTQAGTCHLLCSGSPNQKGHPRGAIRRKCVSGQPPPWQAAHHPEPVPRAYLRRIRKGDPGFRCGLFFLGGVLKADPLWGLRIPMRPFLGGT